MMKPTLLALALSLISPVLGQAEGAKPQIYFSKELTQAPVRRVAIPPSFSSPNKASATIEFIIAPDGSISEARILKASDPAFGEAARVAVLKWIFRPGKLRDKAVYVRATQVLEFAPGETPPEPARPATPARPSPANSPAAIASINQALRLFFNDENLNFDRVAGKGGFNECPALLTKFRDQKHEKLLKEFESRRDELVQSNRVEILQYEFDSNPSITLNVYTTFVDDSSKFEEHQIFYFRFSGLGRLKVVHWGPRPCYKIETRASR